jgi:hypothetical protein
MLVVEETVKEEEVQRLPEREQPLLARTQAVVLALELRQPVQRPVLEPQRSTRCRQQQFPDLLGSQQGTWLPVVQFLAVVPATRGRQIIAT